MYIASACSASNSKAKRAPHTRRDRGEGETTRPQVLNTVKHFFFGAALWEGRGWKPNRRGSRYAKHASKVLYTTARNVSGSAGGQVCFTRSCSRTAWADDIRPNWCGACWPLCTHTHKHTGVVCGVIVKRWRKRI